MISLRDWMEKVRGDNGKLTPRLVVAAARADGPEGCPIYGRFRFDDDETAAELWRVNQARHIIAELKVIYRPATSKTGERSVRAYHAIPDDDNTDACRFEPAHEVATDPTLRAIVLAAMEREWKELKARYGHMSEFVTLVLGSLPEPAA